MHLVRLAGQAPDGEAILTHKDVCERRELKHPLCRVLVVPFSCVFSEALDDRGPWQKHVSALALLANKLERTFHQTTVYENRRRLQVQQLDDRAKIQFFHD